MNLTDLCIHLPKKLALSLSLALTANLTTPYHPYHRDNMSCSRWIHTQQFAYYLVVASIPSSTVFSEGKATASPARAPLLCVGRRVLLLRVDESYPRPNGGVRDRLSVRATFTHKWVRFWVRLGVRVGVGVGLGVKVRIRVNSVLMSRIY